MLKEIDKKEFIKYLKTLGLTVNTVTKARGHRGFFLNNRIDISKNIEENRIIPTLLHEFTHYVHSKMEPDIGKNGGTFTKIFNSDNPVYKNELSKVTQFVDEDSRLVKLYNMRSELKEKIEDEEVIIRGYFSDFKRSLPYKKIEKEIKKSDMKYLLKYDKVKIFDGVLSFKTKIISVDTVENDFSGYEKYVYSYIRLKSYQRKFNRISSRINKYNRYYSRPTEMFARLVEGLYLDEEWVEALAPESVKRFYELLENGYYGELQNVIKR
ncbi:hypothetical protein J6S88_08085 [bacterium]|nr:hypothetical protein [bacterium]